MTKLCLGLHHLGEHKFKHIFQDLINPLCNCGYKIKSNISAVFFSKMKEALSLAHYIKLF